MNFKTCFRFACLTLSVLFTAGFAPRLLANHAWGNYHWERSMNPLTLDIGDNVSAEWDGHLDAAVADWDASSVLNLAKVPGLTSTKNCKAVNNTVQVCADSYGNNGWLGLAQIWVGGDHIAKATTKVNDFYFNQPPYNTIEWRRMVMCQEIGHDFGLGHQDENFNNPNLETCMDYTSDPSTNLSPNNHDYVELEAIYAHLDAASSDTGNSDCYPPWSKKCNANRMGPPPAMDDIDFSGPGQWGKLMARSRDGHQEVYELDFGNGYKVVTHVTWVESRLKPQNK